MKQNADFQEGILQAKSAAKPLPTPKSLTTNESFQMRQYILLHNWASDWFHLLLTVSILLQISCFENFTSVLAFL